MTSLKKEIEVERDKIKQIGSTIRVTLRYADGNSAPIVIDSGSYVSIPSNDYIEVADGVYDRRVEHKGDMRFKWEESAKDLLVDMDFENLFVIFVRFDKGSYFRPHYHETDEEITLIEGSYISNKSMYTKGETQFVPANQIHDWETVEKGFAVLTLKKRQ